MLETLVLKQESFGLDISDLSLKIIKLKKKKNFFKLASFGEVELKPGVISGSEIKDGEIFSKSLRELVCKVNGEKIGTRNVVVSLPEEKSFLQVIQLPKIKQEEIERAVHFEAENYIPVPVDQVYLDFQIISNLNGNSDRLDVLLAAAPRKVIDPYLFYLKKAGLRPVAFEVESQAIARALVKKETSLSPLLLIDLGATRTSFIIFSGSSLRFTTSISVSSKNFTEAISNNLKVDLDEAEKLKKKHGLEEKIKLKLNNKDKLISERGEIFEALIPSLADLTQQIKKYLDYYQNHDFCENLQAGKKNINKILLSGGGASLKGLDSFLSLELKIPVELANPWVNILPEKLEKLPEMHFEKSLGFSTALGLALRGAKNI